MGFSNDYKNASFDAFDSKPEGEYEVIIKSLEEKTFKTGTMGLNMKLLIRNDVDQSCKNGFLFHTFWRRKAPTSQDELTNGYSFNQMMYLSQLAGLPNGKNYDSFEDFLGDMVDKCIRVTLEYDHDRLYNGKPQERISAMTKTHFPDCRHKYKTAAGSEQYAAPQDNAFASGMVVSTDTDDYLPF